jgi:UPF0716 protein FxsA
MSKILWAVAAVLAADIASIFVVNSYAGLTFTLSTVLASALLGVSLICFVVFSEQPFEIEGRNVGEEFYFAALILLAGVLLVLPGLVSDALGLALLAALALVRIARHLKPAVSTGPGQR